jgi:hypothetical protein
MSPYDHSKAHCGPFFKDRFLSRIDMAGPDQCWTWLGSKVKGRGYGWFSIKNKNFYSHRIAYELFVGPIPPGMFVCHHCDNPECVNPSHLFLGTAQDNNTDKKTKGRCAPLYGEKHQNTKISESTVEYIRSSPKRSVDLCKELGLYSSVVSRIRTGKRRAKAWRTA